MIVKYLDHPSIISSNIRAASQSVLPNKKMIYFLLKFALPLTTGLEMDLSCYSNIVDGHVTGCSGSDCPEMLCPVGFNFSLLETQIRINHLIDCGLSQQSS